jgi:hypothetical protein
MPQNGKLDGSWQLIKMTPIDTVLLPKKSPTTPPLIDNGSQMQNYGIYWNIQLDLLTIYTPNVHHNGHTAYTATRFHYTSDKLSITEAYIHYDNRDSLLTSDTDCLTNVGIVQLPEHFEIKFKDRKTMILKSASYLLEFRKF